MRRPSSSKHRLTVICVRVVDKAWPGGGTRSRPSVGKAGSRCADNGRANHRCVLVTGVWTSAPALGRVTEKRCLERKIKMKNDSNQRIIGAWKVLYSSKQISLPSAPPVPRNTIPYI